MAKLWRGAELLARDLWREGRAWPPSDPRTSSGQRERASGRVSVPTGEAACAMCGGPWRDLGHCKGVCLRCGFVQSCVDTL